MDSLSLSHLGSPHGTEGPEISVVYNEEDFPCILHVHCALAVHLFHSRTQVHETALIRDIPGLLAEKREGRGPYDGLKTSTWKWMGCFHWPKQMIWPIVISLGVGLFTPFTETVNVEINITTYHIGCSEEIRFFSKGYMNPLGFFFLKEDVSIGCQGRLNSRSGMKIRDVGSRVGFPHGASGKELICQCRKLLRDVGLIPGSGRSPRGGRGNPLPYACLDREAWCTTFHGVMSWT